MDSPRDRLLILRNQQHNFLNRRQSADGLELASRLLDDMHANRALPTFAELEAIVTNPHTIAGFHDWCQRTRHFVVWTRESIGALAEYLKRGRYQRIVEVGAGRGDLAWHLVNVGIDVIATDAGPSTLAGFTLTEHRSIAVDMWENVRHLTVYDSLERLQPDCVLCSWMPPDDDWTYAFRASTDIRSYVLFWELRGTTGGKSAFSNHQDWTSRNLLDVEDSLIGRTDEGMPNIGVTQYTSVTAFSRFPNAFRPVEEGSGES